jgi:hypothetical protein
MLASHGLLTLIVSAGIRRGEFEELVGDGTLDPLIIGPENDFAVTIEDEGSGTLAAGKPSRQPVEEILLERIDLAGSRAHGIHVRVLELETLHASDEVLLVQVFHLASEEDESEHYGDGSGEHDSQQSKQDEPESN